MSNESIYHKRVKCSGPSSAAAKQALRDVVLGLNGKGMKHFVAGDLEACLACLQRVLNLVHTQKGVLYLLSCCHLACCHHFLSNTSMAFQYSHAVLVESAEVVPQPHHLLAVAHGIIARSKLAKDPLKHAYCSAYHAQEVMVVIRAGDAFDTSVLCCNESEGMAILAFAYASLVHQHCADQLSINKDVNSSSMMQSQLPSSAHTSVQVSWDFRHGGVGGKDIQCFQLSMLREGESQWAEYDYESRSLVPPGEAMHVPGQVTAVKVNGLRAGTAYETRVRARTASSGWSAGWGNVIVTEGYSLPSEEDGEDKGGSGLKSHARGERMIVLQTKNPGLMFDDVVKGRRRRMQSVRRLVRRMLHRELSEALARWTAAVVRERLAAHHREIGSIVEQHDKQKQQQAIRLVFIVLNRMLNEQLHAGWSRWRAKVQHAQWAGRIMDRVLRMIENGALTAGFSTWRLRAGEEAIRQQMLRSATANQQQQTEQQCDQQHAAARLMNRIMCRMLNEQLQAGWSCWCAKVQHAQWAGRIMDRVLRMIENGALTAGFSTWRLQAEQEVKREWMTRHTEEMSVLQAQFEQQKNQLAEQLRALQTEIEDHQVAQAARVSGQQAIEDSSAGSSAAGSRAAGSSAAGSSGAGSSAAARASSTRAQGISIANNARSTHPSTVAPISIPVVTAGASAFDPRSPTSRRTPLPLTNAAHDELCAAPVLAAERQAAARAAARAAAVQFAPWRPVCFRVETAYRRLLSQAWSYLCFNAFPLSISSRTATTLMAPLRQKHLLDGVIVGRVNPVHVADGSDGYDHSSHQKLVALRPHTHLHARKKKRKNKNAGSWFFRSSLLGQMAKGEKLSLRLKTRGKKRASKVMPKRRQSTSFAQRPRPEAQSKSPLRRRLSWLM
jgi:hypothetical protein